jgi:hypothetical protein
MSNPHVVKGEASDCQLHSSNAVHVSSLALPLRIFMCLMFSQRLERERETKDETSRVLHVVNGESFNVSGDRPQTQRKKMFPSRAKNNNKSEERNVMITAFLGADFVREFDSVRGGKAEGRKEQQGEVGRCGFGKSRKSDVSHKAIAAGQRF